jgi:ribosomal protein S18 acetylase RimI-like enzyme
MNKTFVPLLALVLRDQVRADDEQAIRDIVESTGRFSDAEIDVAAELVRERLTRGEASGYFFLVASDGERPVAYACFGPIACTVASFDLYWIAVSRTLQGRGIGRWLVGETEQRIRALGGRRIFIDTSSRADYAPTRGFYQGCGYRQAAILADFYNDGDDKVVFTKELTR